MREMFNSFEYSHFDLPTSRLLFRPVYRPVYFRNRYSRNNKCILQQTEEILILIRTKYIFRKQLDMFIVFSIYLLIGHIIFAV